MKKTTHEQTKIHNTRLILRTIYTEGTISRAEVARITKLTPTTVSDLVQDLVNDKLVSEVGLGVSIGGKPPTLIEVPSNARIAIGVDLSDHEIHGSLINLRGEAIYSTSLPGNLSGDAAVDQIKALIDQLIEKVDPDVLLGIGLGSPGVVSTEEGVVRRAVKYQWEEIPLKAILQKKYRVPVMIANDSQVAALAEYIYGVDLKEKNLVLLKVGEGISAGLIINGKIFFGDGNGAGEIGHISVEPNGILCRCGHLGCLETVSSLRALAQMAREVFPNTEGSSNEALLGMLVKGLEAKNPQSLRIVSRAGEYLGLAVANVVGLLNIHKIVLAGEVSALGEALTQPIVNSMQEKALDALSKQTQILTSKLGNEIVQIGAAALVQQSTLGLF
jgi:predicted NBD/HSP70 family sugar kinase